MYSIYKILLLQVNANKVVLTIIGKHQFVLYFSYIIDERLNVFLLLHCKDDIHILTYI